MDGGSSKKYVIFYTKILIHEYVHAYLSLNQVKYPKEYGKNFSVARYGLNVKKTILKDGIQIEAQTETHDLDEGFTEFIAIMITSSYFGFEIDDKTFEFFLQGGHDYRDITLKVLKMAKIISANPDQSVSEEVIGLFIEAKRLGSIQPLREYVKIKFGYNLSASEVKNLDFSKLEAILSQTQK